MLGAVSGSFAARPTIYAIADAFRPAMASPHLRSMVAARFDAQFLTYYLTNWSVLIGLWVLACWWLKHVSTTKQAQPVSESADVLISAPAFGRPAQGVVRRLPASIGRDVVALQAEDHYVRVHTRLGEALVLASLSDAIEDVEHSGIQGQRTHRSWWVASNGVVSHEQRGRQLVLILLNGVRAPVSLTYRQLAEARGLIAA